MKIPRPTIVDIESFGIEPRPDYPPLPVGVAVKEWGKKSKYFGFGHVVPNSHLAAKYKWNNASGAQALEAIRKAYANPDGVLFHNCKFDLDVIETHFGIAIPPWQRVHDTMFLLFLDDPNARAIGLKQACERLFNYPAGERDELNDWLTTNQPVPGIKISTSLKGKEPPGKYIAYAPAEIVGPYAIGDVERTEALFQYLYPRIAKADMLGAYDRERRLLPVLLDMEKRGVAVDVPLLNADILRYRDLAMKLENWVRTRIGCEPEVNLESGQQLIEALDRSGLVDRTKLGITMTGKPASDAAAINAAVADKQLAATLTYLSRLRTCLGTFMEPWLATAKQSKGMIYTVWHQTRGNGGGARTGRLSSSPNFQNIPTVFDPLFANGIKPPVKDLPPLPLCRRYICSYKNHVLCLRDFSSQELRILAHFEDGAMRKSYLDNPDIDFHQHTGDMVGKTTNVKVIRRDAKTLNFSILYGAGFNKLAKSLNTTVEKARSLLNAYFQAFPGILYLKKDLTYKARIGEPVRTTGGRLYYCEKPRIVDGIETTYEYKMVNTLIQGSAADQTKEAMIRIYEAVGPGHLILSVHDEIVLSVPPGRLEKSMKLLRGAMDEVGDIDVPIRSEGKTGPNWAEMEKTSD
jgi:DNA polymerase-1